MKTQKDKKTDLVCMILLYAAPLAGTGIYGVIRRADMISIMSDFEIAVMLTTI